MGFTIAPEASRKLRHILRVTNVFDIVERKKKQNSLENSFASAYLRAISHHDDRAQLSSANCINKVNRRFRGALLSSEEEQ